jgi:maltose alpha-D-glucosyltransferase / alpha-amylase
MAQLRNLLFTYWERLYPGVPSKILENFLLTIEFYRGKNNGKDFQADWYKDATVYSLYVDLFNKDFPGLIQKLDYLQDLGISCLWLLPILDSPMRDAGFDIQDYFSIRPELTGVEGNEVFTQFLTEAHKRKIQVIFDIAVNHISDQHPWFVEARKSRNNAYRNYFLWSDTGQEYEQARIIFKGIENSNWEKIGDQYFFHRFFSFQPDLNYKNPEVLFAMCRNLLYWQNIGIDGFRADAIPYLWKEEGTECENLTQTHLVVKFFRTLLDYIKPGTLLLAEACQQPNKVIEYMGNGDECHAAYHFPLMPRIFKAIAMKSGKPVIETLSKAFTPDIPESGQWFTFLRCHDELSLELVYVTEEERKFIHDSYCLKPEWDFRLGEGIAARLSELMARDERKIMLAYSIMLALPGTPVIYYGDEFGKVNDESYYEEMIKLTGKDDSRFLVRGKIDWQKLEKDLKDKESLSYKVYGKLRLMLQTRRILKAFGRGNIRFIELPCCVNGDLLAFYRILNNEKLFIIHNMTGKTVEVSLPSEVLKGKEILGQSLPGPIEPFGFRWVQFV